jgi:hypothetical protein
MESIAFLFSLLVNWVDRKCYQLFLGLGLAPTVWEILDKWAEESEDETRRRNNILRANTWDGDSPL